MTLRFPACPDRTPHQRRTRPSVGAPIPILLCLLGAPMVSGAFAPGSPPFGPSSSHARQRSASPLNFEVASVKPASPLSGGVEGGCRGIDSHFAPNDPRAHLPLGRCVITNGRLSHLMSLAFQIPIDRIRGIPDWDRPSRFDVDAEAERPATTTDHQLILMLQNLLVARFHLTLRHNTQQVPIFALQVGKNRLKLHPSALDAKSASPQINGSTLVLNGYSLADLADFLSNLPSIRRPVRDRTGIQGRFDFTLNLMQDPDRLANSKMAIAAWQTAIYDVQAQLGLQVVSGKGPVESLIIVHAEKPTSN